MRKLRQLKPVLVKKLRKIEMDQQMTPVNAEEVVQQSQKIAMLMQIATFLKASKVGVAGEVGAQIQMQILDRQRTTLFINSKLIEQLLLDEFNKLGEELTNAGISLDNMLEGEKKRFAQVYGTSEQ